MSGVIRSLASASLNRSSTTCRGPGHGALTTSIAVYVVTAAEIIILAARCHY
jgi:hypothetical protein